MRWMNKSCIRVLRDGSAGTAAGVAFLALMTATEFQSAGVLEASLLVMNDDAFGRRNRVANGIVAVGIVHESLAELAHGGAAGGSDGGVVFVGNA